VFLGSEYLAQGEYFSVTYLLFRSSLFGYSFQLSGCSRIGLWRNVRDPDERQADAVTPKEPSHGGAIDQRYAQAPRSSIEG
jgi:hypothetical protein